MSPPAQARAGLIGMITGVLGALAAVILLAWPAQSAANLVSHPLTSTGFTVAQVIFFGHHFGLLVVIVALVLSGATGQQRLYRAGAWVAVIGMALLSGVELFAIRYADWDNVTANNGLMGLAYGVACMTIGVGMVIAGIGVIRARMWSGVHRWTALAVGVGLFVVVIPAINGGFVVARLGIGFWMLQFAVLGWSVYTQARWATSHPTQQLTATRAA